MNVGIPFKRALIASQACFNFLQISNLEFILHKLKRKNKKKQSGNSDVEKQSLKAFKGFFVLKCTR